MLLHLSKQGTDEMLSKMSSSQSPVKGKGSKGKGKSGNMQGSQILTNNS